MGEQSLKNLEDMTRFLDCFNRHDVDGIMEYFEEDGVFQTGAGSGSKGTIVEGKAAVREYFSKMFADMPDMHFADDTHWSMGDFGVSEWLLTGTRPDGSRMELWGTDHFHLRNGKIRIKDTYLKMVR